MPPGCRLVFASGVELAATEDMRVFRCADAHTAVYAALGASLAGRRALVALGEAVELPDSRVTGGVAVLMPGAGGDFAGLREAFAASESGDTLVALAPDADYATEADSPETGRYHKQPERFVAESAREEMCPGCRTQGRVLRRGQALAAHDRRRRLLAARRKAAVPGAGRRPGAGAPPPRPSRASPPRCPSPCATPPPSRAPRSSRRAHCACWPGRAAR